jgi:hypothetical protein
MWRKADLDIAKAGCISFATGFHLVLNVEASKLSTVSTHAAEQIGFSNSENTDEYVR